VKDAHLQDPDELAQNFYSGEGPVHPVAQEYTRSEITSLFRENIRQITELVRELTPAQLAYRLPGEPSGPDASGDEEHFDTSEIVTHLAAGIAFHQWGITRALGHERPEFPRPPEGVKTTAVKGRIVGAGGWSGERADELVRLLEGTANRLLAYVETLPDQFDDSVKTSGGLFKDMTPHDWLFVAMVHTAMHLKQIKVMQSQPDYPVG
jgi:DinB superfamily